MLMIGDVDTCYPCHTLVPFPMPGIECETANYNPKEIRLLSLALLMTWILANHTYYPLAPDDFAIPADLLY
jgi:hypothetical protein